MIRKFLELLFFCNLFVSFLHPQNTAEDKRISNKQIEKNFNDGVFSSIDINNIEMWFSNTGVCTYDPGTGRAGCYFPKGSSKTCIFMDGPILGGKVGNDVRVVGSTDKTAFQSGAVIAGKADDPSNPKYRIYRIRKDWKELPDSPEKDQYRKDYDEWPIDEGAPWQYDVYGKKVPKFIGDMQAWWVMNDMNPIFSTQFYGTQPIGTEWQCLIWAYNTPGAIGYTIYRKYRIINKGINDAENCYFSWWGNINIGDPNDDFCGCDTVLGLGYVYNGKTIDAIYGKEAPAVGYNFFQGPMIPTNDPHDIANWDFGQRQGFKNLNLSAFSYSVSSQDQGYCYCDPNSSIILGGIETYNLQKGLKKNGLSWVNPQTNHATAFIFPGDPVSGKGWIDGPTNQPPLDPSDKRILLSCGPFNLLRNDIQEIIVGTIVGVGIDRLTSITILKYYDLSSQAGFWYPEPWPPKGKEMQKITVSELSNKIVLYWGNDENAYSKTESINNSGYKFEGYSVYQVSAANMLREKAVLIATYDIPNGITTLLDRTLDLSTGVVLPKIVQRGTDSGIKRYIIIENDMINNRILVNDQTYYFAVISYFYNSDPAAIPAVIESPFNILSVKPHCPKMGYKYFGTAGEILPVITSVNTDISVIPIVIDPTKTTGHGYEINFDTAGQFVNHKWEVQTFWTITDKITGKIIVKSYNQSGDNNYPIFDGLFVKVIDRNNSNSKNVKFTFTAPRPYSYYPDQVKTDIDKITVFPNPCYGSQIMETDRFNRYVTFSHLPTKATIKIFTLSGALVRALQKNDDTPYIRWNLLNENNLFVASGIYIIYIDMPEIGAKKILKLAIIMESSILDRI